MKPMFNINLDTIILLIVAIMNGSTLYFTRRVEKNTNSMKDALVAAKAKEAYGAGHDDARVEGEAKARAVAAQVPVEESRSK
jgi:hypothetical protein